MRTERSTDLVEKHFAQAVLYGLSGFGAVAFAGLLLAFRGEGMFVPLAAMIGTGGLAALAYAAYCVVKARQVTGKSVVCPYCGATNPLLNTPDEDFDCVECHRLVPVSPDGEILAVSQVRCGFCNGLNYYSEKTEVLLCEDCNHEIPIFQEEGKPSRKSPSAYAAKVDEHTYELVLVTHGHKTEELVGALQSMLALNRNQVKDMLTNLPVTLLTGIPRRKGEMLQAQISIHDGAAELRQLPD